MKTIVELEEMLKKEISTNIFSTPLSVNYVYLNKFLGDSSFIIARVMELYLKDNEYFKNNKIWFDDTLIIRIEKEDQVVSLWGVLIFGIEDITEQFTNPFRFNINLLSTTCTFSYGDASQKAISYEDFLSNRSAWNPSKRNWEFIFD